MPSANISRGKLIFGIQCFVTNRYGSQINQDQGSHIGAWRKLPRAKKS